MDTKKDMEKQGCVWQAKLALRFQTPLQASLQGLLKTHRQLASRVALLCDLDAGWKNGEMEILEKRGLRLACQAGEVI